MTIYNQTTQYGEAESRKFEATNNKNDMKNKCNEIEKLDEGQPTLIDKQQVDTEEHHKQNFQVERLAFFSDAVFAIAITLLVIEFKAPTMMPNSDVDDVLRQLFDLKYHFIALLMSFALIAIHWTRHHRLFKYIRNYNTQIIVANMFVLFPIIFFPFTTTFFAESIATTFSENDVNGRMNEFVFLGFKLFFINNFFALLTSSIFYWVTIIRYKEMSFVMPLQEKIKYTIDSFFGIGFFGIVSIAFFVSRNIFILDMIMISLLLVRTIIRKKILKSRKQQKDRIIHE
jgi:uncharacterized membrane protein